jgi:energy-coupling factor transporter ATP-binding protein EcfA2
VTEITANELNLTSSNGSELFNVSFEWQSPQIVAICSNDTELIPALAMALRSQIKDIDGQLTIDGQPVSRIKRQVEEMVSVAGELRIKPRKRLDKWLQHLINKFPDAIHWEQAAQLLRAFNIDGNVRLKELTTEQERLIQVLVPTILCSPVIMLGQEFDQLSAGDVPKVWSLLKDYCQKTNALVVMSSSDVTTMLKWADVMYYFDRGHLTSTRQLPAHDSTDCVVTITGSGFPSATAERVGARLLEEAEHETRLLFSGNIQALLPLLEQNTITDVRIQDATIEDELLAY